MSNAPVFVFGSNLAGRHGRGAALWAKLNRGAVQGVGVGRQGMSYAIPTKGDIPGVPLSDPRQTLPLDRIRPYVEQFIRYARGRPQETYEVTAIGCGLAGYAPEQIAPMFAGHSANVILPPSFIAVLAKEKT